MNRKTILCADGSPGWRFIIVGLMAAHDVEVLCCETSDEVLRCMKDAPDLVVADLRLPDTWGDWRLITVLREQHHVPVIVHTAIDRPEDRQRAEELGVTAFIVRSGSLCELEAAIMGVLVRAAS